MEPRSLPFFVSMPHLHSLHFSDLEKHNTLHAIINNLTVFLIDYLCKQQHLNLNLLSSQLAIFTL